MICEIENMTTKTRKTRLTMKVNLVDGIVFMIIFSDFHYIVIKPPPPPPTKKRY